MSDDFWHHMRGSSGDSSAPGAGYEQYKRDRDLKEQIRRTHIDSESRHRNSSQESGYKPFATTEKIIAGIPGIIYFICGCAGMIAAVTLVQMNFPGVARDILAREAGLLTWLVFPAAAIGGFFVGKLVPELLVLAADALVKLAIVASIFAVILGVIHLVAKG